MKLNLDLADFRYTHHEVAILSELAHFKGAWLIYKNLPHERLKYLQNRATTESVESSGRIGIRPIESCKANNLSNGMEELQPAKNDEQKFSGYARALSLIYSSWKDLALSKNLIQQLHTELLGLSKESTEASSFIVMKNRKGDNCISGAPTVAETTFLMNQLVEWFNCETERGVYHPVLLISVFMVAFLSIHPFKNGNGRLSRIIATLLLLRSGFAYVPFSSLESVVEKSAASYGVKLYQSKMALERDEPDWRPFFDCFLECLLLQVKTLKSRISLEYLAIEVPELSFNILKLLKDGHPIGISELEKSLGAPRSTIRFHLRRLISDKSVISLGQARAVQYMLGEKGSIALNRLS